MRSFLLTVALAAAPLLAQEPAEGGISLPDCGNSLSPVTVPKVTGATLYVFGVPKDVLVLTSPPGLAVVTKEAGPVKIKGKFIDSAGIVTRTFKDKWVYQVDPAPGVRGRIELLVVPAGTTDEKAVVRKLLDMDGTANPGPVPPGPQPPPTPPDPTPPVSDVKMSAVVLIEETELAQRARAAFLSDPALQARMKERGIKLRTADKDVVGPNGAPPADLVEFMEKAKAKAYPQVFFVGYKDGKRVTVYQGDLPATTAELIQLMSKYGG